MLECVTPTKNQCRTNADCAPKYTKHRVTQKDTLASISRKYGMSQKSILLANEFAAAKQVQAGASIVIPIIFECAHFGDQSVCAKPNGMCPSGDKCQRNEVCDMRFSHTDHLHLYKHGICLCAEAEDSD